MKLFIYSPISPSLEANVAYLNIYEENDKLISMTKDGSIITIIMLFNTFLQL